MSTDDQIIEGGFRDGKPIRMRADHLEHILDVARFLNPRANSITIDSEAIDADIDWTAAEIPHDAVRKVAEQVRIT